MELRTQPLPTESEWAEATATAGALLGVHAAPHLTAPAVADLERKAIESAKALSGPAPTLVSALELAYGRLRVDSGARLDTARASGALVQRLTHLSGVELVRRLASADLGGATPAAAGTSLASAEKVAGVLGSFDWRRLDPLLEAMRREGDAATRAAAVVNDLRSALQQDELVTSADRALKAADDAIFSWLRAHLAAPPGGRGDDTDGGPVIEPPVSRGGRARKPAGTSDGQVLEELGAFLTEHRTDEVEVTWRVVP